MKIQSLFSKALTILIVWVPLKLEAQVFFGSPGEQVKVTSDNADNPLVDTAGIFGYWEYLGVNFNPTNEHNLIIFFHGNGEVGDGTSEELDKVTNWGIPKILKGLSATSPLALKLEHSIVISPQLHTRRFWIESDVRFLVNKLIEVYSVDIDKVYLAGFSAGGAAIKRYIDQAHRYPIIPAAFYFGGMHDPAIGSKHKDLLSDRGVFFYAGGNETDFRFNNAITSLKNITDVHTGLPTKGNPVGSSFASYFVNGDVWVENLNDLVTNNTNHIFVTEPLASHLPGERILKDPEFYDWLFSFDRGGTNNQAPVANAGINQEIVLPIDSTTLDGSGSMDDIGISSYEWTFVSGPITPMIASPSESETMINNLSLPGTYGLSLTVTDEQGAQSTDEVLIAVSPINEVPVANAGIDQAIVLPVDSTTLDGSGSMDDVGISSYEWTFVSGPITPMIVSPSESITIVRDLSLPGTYALSLMVTDEQGAQSTDEVLIAVSPINEVPVANAGIDQAIVLPVDSTTLDGSGSMDDIGISSYEWTFVSGPITPMIVSPSESITIVRDLSLPGTYALSLTVTDEQGAQSTDEVLIAVSPINEVPVANAGIDQAIVLPVDSTTLDGSGSMDDVGISSYEWTFVSGPITPMIVSPSESITIVRDLSLPGTYGLSLTVTDEQGAQSTDEVLIAVSPINEVPVANAGVDQTITLPLDSTTLDGSGSMDDVGISSYEWTFVSGPITPTIVSPSESITVVRDLSLPGTYGLSLTVTDEQGAQSTDEVLIAVSPINEVPVANAGVDQTITLPLDSTTLDGSGSMDDVGISSYEWTFVSGPITPTIVSPSESITVVRDLSLPGTYGLSLTVTDEQGAQSTDEVLIAVSPINEVPVANAGIDQAIVLPVDSTTLDGSGSMDDIGISSYEWTFVSGPITPMIASPSESETMINNLSPPGTYGLSLTVTDEQGAQSTDEVLIAVSPINEVPVANAGIDQAIVLPVDSTTLDGSGSMDDVGISSYEWTFVSGPITPTIVSPSESITVVRDLSLPGTYGLSLTVTDEQGAQSTDEVLIDVFTDPIRDSNPVVTCINFNPPGAPSASSSWNESDRNNKLVNLKDSSGVDQGIDVDLVQAWSMKTGGVTLDAENTDFPNEVRRGFYYFSRNGNLVTRELKFSGLDVSSIYTFKFLSSRTGSGDRTTVFYANGLSDSVNASSNVSDYAVLEDLVPDENGDLSITIGIGSGARYAYLNAIIIKQETVKDSPPVSDAGVDQTITLPLDSTTLDGSGSMDDVGITSYEWSFLSGPSTPNITLSDQPRTKVNDLSLPGTYVLSLTVMDEQGGHGTDSVFIEVLPEEIIEPKPIVTYINFNPPGAPSASASWNESDRNNKLVNLKDSSGVDQGIDMDLVQAWSMKTGGVTLDAENTDFPNEVRRGFYYFSRNGNLVTRELKFSGLDVSSIYTFKFLSSRTGSGDRTTVFYANGLSDSVNASSNVSDYAVLEDLVPDENGDLSITIGIGSGARYAYLNAIIIESNTNNSSLERSSLERRMVENSEMITTTSSPILYPNPTSDILNYKGIADVQIIYVWDVNGKFIEKFNPVNERIIDVSNLKRGIYSIEFVTETNKVQLKINVEN